MARTIRPVCVLLTPPAAPLARVRDLRMAIWLTPFITDADTRQLLLELADRIAEELPTQPPDVDRLELEVSNAA